MPVGIIDLELNAIEEHRFMRVMHNCRFFGAGESRDGDGKDQCERGDKNVLHHMLPWPAWAPCAAPSLVTPIGRTAPSGVMALAAVSGGSTMKAVIMPETM